MADFLVALVEGGFDCSRVAGLDGQAILDSLAGLLGNEPTKNNVLGTGNTNATTDYAAVSKVLIKFVAPLVIIAVRNHGRERGPCCPNPSNLSRRAAFRRGSRSVATWRGQDQESLLPS